MAIGTKTYYFSLSFVSLGFLFAGCQQNQSSQTSSASTSGSSFDNLGAYYFLCSSAVNYEVLNRGAAVGGTEESQNLPSMSGNVPDNMALVESNGALGGSASGNIGVTNQKLPPLAAGQQINSAFTQPGNIIHAVYNGRSLPVLKLAEGSTADSQGNSISCNEFAKQLSAFAKKSNVKASALFLTNKNLDLNGKAGAFLVFRPDSVDNLSPLIKLDETQANCLPPAQGSNCGVQGNQSKQDKQEGALLYFRQFAPSLVKVGFAEGSWFAKIGEELNVKLFKDELQQGFAQKNKLSTSENTLWCNSKKLDVCLVNGGGAGCFKYCASEPQEGDVRVNVERTRNAIKAAQGGDTTKSLLAKDVVVLVDE